ncbi:MAG: 1-hydroxycarotenoid 3,4-desaturase CrtD [Chitinophagales bacterium]
MKVLIIGSGVAGLASAIRMAARGYKVEVFEANAYPGGKLTEISLGDYRFDAGPSLFTMPEYFEELFQLAGKSFQDYCPYDRLDTVTKYFYEDGTVVEAFKEPKDFANELELKLNIPKQTTLDHLANSAKIYDLTQDVFLNHSLHSLMNNSPLKLLKASSRLPQIDIFRTMHQANEKAFKNDKAIQLFDRYATYNGSNPYQAPATLNIIPHLEFNIGAFFPKNGMHALTESMVKLGKELGVQYHFNSPVDEILVENNKAIGISVKGKNILGDKVISAADIMLTYRKLLKDQKAPEKILKQPKSTSAIIFYWGIKKEFPELDLHNILFSKNYKEEFEAISKNNRIYHDPTVYINISSKRQKSDAPNGKENWFILINAPNDNGQDWDQLISETRKHTIKKVNSILKTNIEPFIEEEDILEPRLIEQRTGSYAGALYGNASNNKMAAFWRHANYSSKIENLYFGGGSVHPGGGIPLCMLSAKIIDELIHQ